MSSFYGGRPGAPFVIRKAFASIEDMNLVFRDGDLYKDVWYGEYCIIDTKNKDDKDNGKIFKRVTNPIVYTEDITTINPCYGEYIGQIVGPSGPAPLINLKGLNEVKVAGKPVEVTPANTKYTKTFLSQNIDGVISRIQENEKTVDYKTPHVFNLSTNLVPGYDGKTYKDNISYAWYNVRLDGNDATTTCVMGFEVPYLVQKFEASTVGYSHPATVTEAEDSKQHPFYQKLLLSIPHGIPGISISDYQKINPANYTNPEEVPLVLLPKAIIFDKEGRHSVAPTPDNIYMDKNNYQGKKPFYIYMTHIHTTDSHGQAIINDYYIFAHESTDLINIEYNEPTNTSLANFMINQDNTSTKLEFAMDYIKQVHIDRAGYVYVLFSNQVKLKDNNNVIAGNMVPDLENGLSEDKWVKYNSVKDYSGVLIGISFTDDDIKANPATNDKPGDGLNYLRTLYPDGLLEDKVGRVAVHVQTTASQDGTVQKPVSMFYGFDYTIQDTGKPRGWFAIGSIDETASDAELGNDFALATNLKNNGLFFVEKTVVIENASYPY